MTRAARGAGRRSLIAAAAALLLVAAFGGSAVASSPTRWDHNLVKDPGAEGADVAQAAGGQVPIPGWHEIQYFTAETYHPNPFFYPKRKESHRIGGGTNFFSCGPEDAKASAQQVIPLVGRVGAIDAGRVRLRLGAWIATHGSELDKGRVYVWALDGSDLVIGTLKTGWVTQSHDKFLHKQTQMVLPVGTRTLEVVLDGRRNPSESAGYCDAYFDNIDVRIQKVA